MTDNKQQTITDILQNTLSLIENEGNLKNNNTMVPVSTSRKLLNHIRKRQRENEEDNYYNDSNGNIKIIEKSNLIIPPLLQQISSSSVDPPTYWKDNKRDSKIHKVANYPSGNKIKKIKKLKGESYKDKHNEKVLNKVNKKQRIQILGKAY